MWIVERRFSFFLLRNWILERQLTDDSKTAMIAQVHNLMQAATPKNGSRKFFQSQKMMPV